MLGNEGETWDNVYALPGDAVRHVPLGKLVCESYHPRAVDEPERGVLDVEPSGHQGFSCAGQPDPGEWPFEGVPVKPCDGVGVAQHDWAVPLDPVDVEDVAVHEVVSATADTKCSRS